MLSERNVQCEIPGCNQPKEPLAVHCSEHRAMYGRSSVRAGEPTAEQERNAAWEINTAHLETIATFQAKPQLNISPATREMLELWRTERRRPATERPSYSFGDVPLPLRLALDELASKLCASDDAFRAAEPMQMKGTSMKIRIADLKTWFDNLCIRVACCFLGHCEVPWKQGECVACRKKIKIAKPKEDPS
jgi:hypothetical protein